MSRLSAFARRCVHVATSAPTSASAPAVDHAAAAGLGNAKTSLSEGSLPAWLTDAKNLRLGATVALGTIAFAVEFGAIQSGVKAVDTRVSELSTRVGEGNTNLSTRISEGNTNLSKRISEGITSLNGHLSSLDARVTDTNNRLTKLEDNVTHIGRTLEGMSKMLAKLANASVPPRTPKDDA